MSYPQVAVWIDQQEARIFQVEAESFSQSTIHAVKRHVDHEKRKKFREKNHPQDDQHFFRDVAHALRGRDPILVVGPSTAKFHFLKYIHEHDHTIEPRIVGVETVDHPSHLQLADYVRRYFAASEQVQ